jgi:putative acetyltransferase
MVRLTNALSERPWAIARILPSAKAYIVARFRNRQDADDHLRVLYRFIPSAIFEIVFDIPDEEEPNEQA